MSHEPDGVNHDGPASSGTSPAAPASSIAPGGSLNRRSLLTAGLAGAAALALPRAGRAEPRPGEAGRSADARRVLRFAHLTDVHAQKARAAGEGFAAALHHAQNQPDPPEFIVFGGDNVMNVDGDGRATAAEQLAVWNSVLRADCSRPVLTAVGNHDVLALDPADGKKWAVDAFGLPGRYYHADRAGWRFVMLDSTSPEGGGYKGRIDEEQFSWLESLLAATPAPTPVCVVSHIPIMGVCCYFDGNNEQTGDWRVPGSWMHIDARRLKDLFAKHPGVRLCVSGHMHLADEATYLGVRYACNGAVSGAWWGGSYHEFAPGYALIDLYEDGSNAVEFVTFGWTPRD